MEAAEHRVAVVVDQFYAERIIDVARRCHAWVVRSAPNDAVVAMLREDDPTYSAEAGVTTFSPGDTPQASFLSILGTVELHHGAYSHDPPLSVIEVIGLEPTAAVRGELDSHGFHDVQPFHDGFVARRGSD